MWRHASNDEENVNASSLRGNRLSANCFKNWVIWKTSGEGSFLWFAYTSLLLPGLLQMPWWWCVWSVHHQHQGLRRIQWLWGPQSFFLLKKLPAPQWYPALRRADFMFDKWSGFLIIHRYYYFCPELIDLIFMVNPVSLLVNVALYRDFLIV